MRRSVTRFGVGGAIYIYIYYRLWFRNRRREFQLADNTFSLAVPNRTIETSIVRSVNRYRPNTSSRIRVNKCACVKPLAKPKPEQQPEPNQHL